MPLFRPGVELFAKSTTFVLAASFLGNTFVCPSSSQASTIIRAVGPLTGNDRPKATLDYDETTVQDTCKLFNARDGRLSVYQGNGSTQTISSFENGLTSISSENPESARISVSSTAASYKLKVENAQLFSPNSGVTTGISRKVRVNNGVIAPSVEVAGLPAGLNNINVDVEFIRGQGFTSGGVYNAQVTVSCIGS